MPPIARRTTPPRAMSPHAHVGNSEPAAVLTETTPLNWRVPVHGFVTARM